MNLLTVTKRVAQGTAFLSLFAYVVSPVLNAIGVNPPQQLSTAVDLAKYAVLYSAAFLAVTAVLILGLGYLALTGWRNYKSAPFAMRILFAAGLGLSSILMSGIFGLVIPIPLVPTCLSAATLWIALRTISNSLFDTNNHAGGVDISHAETAASHYLAGKGFDNLQVKEAELSGDSWKVVLAGQDSESYEVEVNRSEGRTTGWRRV